jgi:hypothetical protein
MLLLGVVQAQAFETAAAGSYDLLATEILTGSQASVTFSDLGDYATDYQHLQLRIVSKHSDAFDNFLMRFNSDSGNNYSFHNLTGNGSTVTSNATTSTNAMRPGVSSGTTTGVFAPTIIDILDPYSTTKNKTVRSLTGNNDADTTIRLRSGAYYSTDAISSIQIVGGYSFVAGSRFSLYGLKASV